MESRRRGIPERFERFDVLGEHPPSATDEYFYFVVRARDRAGNEDSNKIEREGQNLCE